jgi:uncharacterized protein (TIGR02246 family)
MNKLFFLLGFLCLIALLLPACAPAPEPEREPAPEPVFDQAAEEAAVRGAEEQFIVFWNAHDGKALCASYVEDAQSWSGEWKGRAACETSFGELFAGSFKNFQVELLEELGIVFVTPDVAIYSARYGYSGVTNEAGETSPPAKTRYARVYVKKNGTWMGAYGQFNLPIEE